MESDDEGREIAEYAGIKIGEQVKIIASIDGVEDPTGELIRLAYDWADTVWATVDIVGFRAVDTPAELLIRASA